MEVALKLFESKIRHAKFLADTKLFEILQQVTDWNLLLEYFFCSKFITLKEENLTFPNKIEKKITEQIEKTMSTEKLYTTTYKTKRPLRHLDTFLFPY